MKIGVVIVTFNPNIERLLANIKSISNQIDDVVIVDNNSNDIDNISQLSINFNLRLLKLSQNFGIATAQNIGIKYLQKLKFDWVLTLDQDSILPGDTISKFQKSRAIKKEDTGIIAGQNNDLSWTSAQRDARIKSKTGEIIRTRAISSGNLVRISAWSRVNGFDETLFIDQVDFDFDTKLILVGYKIWQINEIIFIHEIGNTINKPRLSKLLLVPKTQLTNEHPPFREYYINRNTIIYSKRYPSVRGFKYQLLVNIVNLRKIFLYDNYRFKSFKSAIRGIIDGMQYNPKNDKEFQNFMKTVH